MTLSFTKKVFYRETLRLTVVFFVFVVQMTGLALAKECVNSALPGLSCYSSGSDGYNSYIRQGFHVKDQCDQICHTATLLTCHNEGAVLATYYCFDSSEFVSSSTSQGSATSTVSSASAATNTGAAANVTLTKAQCTSVSGRVCKTTPASGDVCQSAATDCGQCCMPSSAGSTTTPSSTTASSGTTTAATTGTGSSNSSDTSGASTATGIVIPTKAQTGLSEASLADVITSLAASLLEIFGIIAVIAFIVTGFQYLLANGDEKETQGAKRNLTYSIISVIVALSGVIIVGAINSLLNASPNGFF